MPKSKSNRDSLVTDLQSLVEKYQAKPSTLLAELEHFMDINTIPKKNPYPSVLSQPAWKVHGFKSKQEMTDFENRSDFPGWDAL